MNGGYLKMSSAGRSFTKLRIEEIPTPMDVVRIVCIGARSVVYAFHRDVDAPWTVHYLDIQERLPWQAWRLAGHEQNAVAIEYTFGRALYCFAESVDLIFICTYTDAEVNIHS
jgi:hypothetical protein